jgi:uncharacterized protein involved in outer membrane biogenesis
MAASKSRLFLILGAIAAIAIIAVVAIGFSLGGAVTAGVNTFAPKITGTTVTLESAKISPLTGSGTLTGLVVGNPSGWSENNLASFAKVHVEVDPMSLLGDTLVIDDMVIEAPEFRYETKIIASNVKDLLKNIEAAVGLGSSEPEVAAESPARRLAVKHFILRNGKVTIGTGAAAITVPLPDLELNNLGTPEKGLTPPQLIAAVSKDIVGDILVAATKALTTAGGTSGAAALESVKNVGGAIKGLFGGNKEEEKEEPNP